jgi:nitrite reductase/ring-hydroxylating ferredoxin subunit
MAFQHASSLDELLPNSMRAVTVTDTPVLLVREGDQVYALEPRCGHMGGPLPEGTLEGHVVICPWHGSQYDVRTGRALRGPYRIPVLSRLLTGLAKPRATYPVRIVGGSVEVDLDAASRTAAS